MVGPPGLLPSLAQHFLSVAKLFAPKPAVVVNVTVGAPAPTRPSSSQVVAVAPSPISDLSGYWRQHVPLFTFIFSTNSLFSTDAKAIVQFPEASCPDDDMGPGVFAITRSRLVVEHDGSWQVVHSFDVDERVDVSFLPTHPLYFELVE